MGQPLSCLLSVLFCLFVRAVLFIGHSFGGVAIASAPFIQFRFTLRIVYLIDELPGALHILILLPLCILI
jgi:hypothetical protein